MMLINHKLLVSDAKNFTNAEPINPYYKNEDVDAVEAEKEHHVISRLFEQAGIEVVRVPSPLGCQDGIYTANWALVRDGRAVLSRLPNARKEEEDYAENILAGLGFTVYRVPGEYRFSGQGDALPCGGYLFAGSGYRSDPEAQKYAAETLGFRLIQLQTVPDLDNNGAQVVNGASGWPDSHFYDLDLALAVIKAPTEGKKGLIAYCPEALVADSRRILEEIDFVDKIIISLEDARDHFAANLVSTGEVVIMNSRAKELAENLRLHGLEILSPDVVELAKGGGNIRCVSLTLG